MFAMEAVAGWLYLEPNCFTNGQTYIYSFEATLPRPTWVCFQNIQKNSSIRLQNLYTYIKILGQLTKPIQKSWVRPHNLHENPWFALKSNYLFGSNLSNENLDPLPVFAYMLQFDLFVQVWMHLKRHLTLFTPGSSILDMIWLPFWCYANFS